MTPVSDPGSTNTSTMHPAPKPISGSASFLSPPESQPLDTLYLTPPDAGNVYGVASHLKESYSRREHEFDGLESGKVLNAAVARNEPSGQDWFNEQVTPIGLALKRTDQPFVQSELRLVPPPVFLSPPVSPPVSPWQASKAHHHGEWSGNFRSRNRSSISRSPPCSSASSTALKHGLQDKDLLMNHSNRITGNHDDSILFEDRAEARVKKQSTDTLPYYTDPSRLDSTRHITPPMSYPNYLTSSDNGPPATEEIITKHMTMHLAQFKNKKHQPTREEYRLALACVPNISTKYNRNPASYMKRHQEEQENDYAQFKRLCVRSDRSTRYFQEQGRRASLLQAQSSGSGKRSRMIPQVASRRSSTTSRTALPQESQTSLPLPIQTVQQQLAAYHRKPGAVTEDNRKLPPGSIQPDSRLATSAHRHENSSQQSLAPPQSNVKYSGKNEASNSSLMHHRDTSTTQPHHLIINKNGNPRTSAKSHASNHPSSNGSITAKRDDIDFNSLPDHCPPLSSLPSEKNAAMKLLKADWPASHTLDLSQDPDRHLLHDSEVNLAATLRLSCATYLCSKRRIFVARLHAHQIGKEFRKTDAQQACRIDVNKASKLWTAFDRAGWFDGRWLH